MARWEPDASGRLVVAALELFAERGYENTTVVQIAERAGLTKSTFFRHFPDKREVLFGGESMARILVDAIAAAPAETTPLGAVALALEAVGRVAFTSERRGFVASRHTVIADNVDLREREALKELGLTAAMAGALRERGMADSSARVAAALGSLGLEIAYERWLAPNSRGTFGDIAREALEELRAAVPD